MPFWLAFDLKFPCDFITITGLAKPYKLSGYQSWWGKNQFLLKKLTITNPDKPTMIENTSLKESVRGGSGMIP